MARKWFPVTIYVLALAVHACGNTLQSFAVPTLSPTSVPTLLPTQPILPTSVGSPLAELPTVEITGNVYVRDGEGGIHGWLSKGQSVQAACSGNWCVLANGLRFWRGCSSDNPASLGCQSK